MKNILVTGSNGQLGSEINSIAARYTSCKFYFTDVADLNICDLSALDSFAASRQIHYIVNCAAYTAVDQAEDDPERCYLINAKAVENIGVVASKYNARVIHVSTDYVYSGISCRPYTEEDEIGPKSVYGITKLQGEELLFAKCNQSIVIRTSWLYSVFGNNFVKTMLRLGKEKSMLGIIFDQIGTPTNAADLAEVIMNIIDKENDEFFKYKTGVYNYSNEGACSWYDFTKSIHRIAGITTCDVRPIEGSDYQSKAERPFYSVMNKKKIKNTFKIQIPHWEESLEKCMKAMLEAKN